MSATSPAFSSAQEQAALRAQPRGCDRGAEGATVDAPMAHPPGAGKTLADTARHPATAFAPGDFVQEPDRSLHGPTTVNMRYRQPLLIACLAWACAQPVWAQGQTWPPPACQKLADEFHTIEWCPAAIPPIAQVQMHAPTPREKSRPGEDCRSFRPSLAAVHRFWAQAGQISGADYMNALDAASCGAGGTLTLQDGRQATWHVNAARKGTLRIEGEPEEKALYLFCPQCNFAPFWDWNTDRDFLPAAP